MKASIRLLKGVTPSALVEEVKKCGNEFELIRSPFVSHSGLVCQWVDMMPFGLYEYTLIEAKDLDDLEAQVVKLSGEGYEFEHEMVQWFDVMGNGERYLQWMKRYNTTGARVRDAVAGLFVPGERGQELALVEDVRAVLHLEPTGNSGYEVSIPFFVKPS